MAERAVADRGATLDWDTGDLRHWASLPATLQLIVAEIPEAEDETPPEGEADQQAQSENEES